MWLKKKDKIVVAMSGGVDSSTVAAILHDQGYDVVGVTMQLYNETNNIVKKGSCCAGQDIYDAKIVADKIGIPHYVLNYKSIFNQQVIKEFVASYLQGETPIPCIKCNQKVKFRDLYEMAKNLGAKSLATGHYVRKVKTNNCNILLKGIDFNKDQSYFLFSTTKKQLNFLDFPLGWLTKDETRRLAKKYELNIASKPDSQDICFIPNGNYAEIIKKLKPDSYFKGNIVNLNGKVLGSHNGIINFTIGQRKRIGISSNKPLYVLKINPKTNEVIVGDKNCLKSTILYIKDFNWLCSKNDLKGNINCFVRLRASHKEIEANIKYLGNGRASIILESSYYGITPGQACVMYNDNKLLGGGWIVKEI